MNVICGIALLLACFSVFSCSLGLKEKEFHAGTLCDLRERMDKSCSKHVTETKTFNECVFKCDLDPACVGASTAGNQGRCFHHFTCNEVSGCSKKEATHKYMSKYCAHDGVWDPRTSKCVCESGWIGDHCLDLPTKCRDLQKHGRTVSMRAYLRLQSVPSPVFCTVAAPPSTWFAVLVLWNYGGINFNRTWKEYRDGFYIDDKKFWIGLESWHVLSMAGYTTLVVSMNVGNRYREYYNFQIHDESQRYSFTFDSTVQSGRSKIQFTYMNHFHDCLGPLSNKPFVTRDTGNTCALEVGSGWWHDGDLCTTSSTYCNLLGKVPRDWGEDVPVYQRMRVDGIDPLVMEQQSVDVGTEMYVTIP